jgi:SAM-dependent methyltransferase
MAIDTRQRAAAYYDLDPRVPGDIPFYRARIPSPDARVLELGCGTGRVLASLVASCRYVHGIDSSPAMLERCQDKLRQADIPPTRAFVEHGDVTRFELDSRFDLIIVPYVFQILRTDEEVEGLFRCIRKHLRPNGTCILNTPKPPMEPDALRRDWCIAEEQPAWEVKTGSVRVTCHYRRRRMDPQRLILYPDLVFRRHEAGVLKDETVMSTVMRCWYPDEILDLIVGQGFEIQDSWGGYAGEQYGSGAELVAQFKGRTTSGAARAL